MTHAWLGIDIGGTSTRLLTLQNDNEWSGFTKVPTASWATASDPLAGLGQLITSALAERPVSGVMLGLPGILSRDRHQVISLPFIQKLDGLRVAESLSDIVGVPVAMDKDVNHLMLWDLMQLEQLPQNAVGFYLGTGMGNSLWLNGHFYHGSHGGSGEIGHSPWADNHQPCPCGNRGCVETLTSGNWLSGWAKQQFPHESLSKLFSYHGHHPELQQFITRLAKMIASEMNILDPEYLILGGGVLAMDDFPLESLHQQIIAHLRPPVTRAGLNIINSQASDLAGCRGACLAAARYFGSL